MPVEWIYVAIVRLKTVQYLLNDGWKKSQGRQFRFRFLQNIFSGIVALVLKRLLE